MRSYVLKLPHANDCWKIDNLYSTKSTIQHKMSAEFSNTDTGSKPADPYKATNKDEPGTEEKIEALSQFISASKFGMMTTRIADSGLLVSRCMAVAGKVSSSVNQISINMSSFTCTEHLLNEGCPSILTVILALGEGWYRSDLPHQYRVRENV